MARDEQRESPALVWVSRVRSYRAAYPGDPLAEEAGGSIPDLTFEFRLSVRCVESRGGELLPPEVLEQAVAKELCYHCLSLEAEQALGWAFRAVRVETSSRLGLTAGRAKNWEPVGENCWHGPLQHRGTNNGDRTYIEAVREAASKFRRKILTSVSYRPRRGR